MNREEVIALMKISKSETEWNANCDKVKEACGGYPDYWYPDIIGSGLADRVSESFSVSAGISIVTIVISEKRPLSIYGRPTEMPNLQKNEVVVGIYNQGLGEKTLVCRTLTDMQSLYDSYYSGMALTLKWAATQK